MMHTVSDWDKARVRRAFGAASASYDGVATLQRAIGEQLFADHLPANLHGTVVDAGCGTGFCTARLAACHGWECLLAVDMALPMLQIARLKLAESQPVFYLSADMERLPLLDGCVDWLVSNLAMQWSRNLPVLAAELQRVLKSQGRLVFSTFGPNTLQELKAAWAAADRYSHVNRFPCRDELEASLQHAGFDEVAIVERLITARYPSPIVLMRELKMLGAYYVPGRKRGVTTRTQLHKMLAAYEKLRSCGSLPATFQAFYVTAIKP